MKKKIFAAVLLGGIVLASGCNNQETPVDDSAQRSAMSSSSGEPASNGDVKPEYLTAQTFKEKVWDYEVNPEQWVYNGELPCIIDFYADWCKPCKMVAPIMDDLADHYKGKVLIYKVNTDEQRELASVFQVRSIPSILFAPLNGKPAIQAGAMSKEDYIRIIDDFILKENKQNNDKTES